ncbi:Alpha/Beta hydrolase protein [Mycena vulgaris]|nr:Alpha/Beta hydrolase protein [Mycena vulgaris]
MNTSNGTDIAPSCSRLWLAHILNSAVDADSTYSLRDTQPLPSTGGAYPPILDSRRFCGKESIDQEVVTADLRGHGRSGRPTSPDAYQSKIFVDDFITVMDAFGLGKPVLAAWSMGAAVATDVAAHLPPATLSGVIYLAGVPSTG